MSMLADRKVLEAALEQVTRFAGMLGLMLAHQLGKTRGRHKAVGVIAALEQLTKHMAGAAANVQNAYRARLRRWQG